MRIAVSGASGMIGSALLTHLASKGHRMVRLVRGRPARDDTEVAWNPDKGTIDTAGLEGVDAAINVSGASIAHWPWTHAHEHHVLESRTRSTALLARSLAALDRKPQVLISASAVGYYGNRGDEKLDERSGHGSGFLSNVCRAWESAADPASQAGIRVVWTRFGLVLSGAGGVLPTMSIPFKLGLGGMIGDGRQYMSWISIVDLADAIAHAISREDLEGPMNVVAPHPVTNQEFTKTLGRVLHRPTLIPLPAWVARALLGRMADETLLTSQRVEPVRLIASGFVFRFSQLEPALAYALHAR